MSTPFLILLIFNILISLFVVVQVFFKKTSSENPINLDKPFGDLKLELFSFLSNKWNEHSEKLDKQFDTTRGGLQSGMLALGRSSDERAREMSKQTLEELRLMRNTIDAKLRELQEDNSKKIEKMRETVDEKLQKTLEFRLNESFKNVRQILDTLNQKFGSISQLSTDFKAVEKIFQNVKTKGIFGEGQLENLLAEVLAPNQYRKDVSVRPDTAERVEFAIVVLGDENDKLLPIDAKFPIKPYEDFVDASNRGDKEAVKTLEKELSKEIKKQAKKIEKYIVPPRTMDYAIMFLPAESLYIEADRLGLINEVWGENRVMITGPTILNAVLHSFKLNFRLMALGKHQHAVVDLLSRLQKEFRFFVEALGKSEKKISDAGKSVKSIHERTIDISRDLEKFDSTVENTIDSKTAKALKKDRAEEEDLSLFQAKNLD